MRALDGIGSLQVDTTNKSYILLKSSAERWDGGVGRTLSLTGKHTGNMQRAANHCSCVLSNTGHGKIAYNRTCAGMAFMVSC